MSELRILVIDDSIAIGVWGKFIYLISPEIPDGESSLEI